LPENLSEKLSVQGLNCTHLNRLPHEPLAFMHLLEKLKEKNIKKIKQQRNMSQTHARK